MKKQIFLLGAAAALLTMGSCSSSDDGPKSPSGTGEAVTSFMAVNIVQPNEGTRAEGDQDNDTDSQAPNDNNGSQTDATYEEGFKKENAVKKVRFYFFKSDGSACNVKYVKDGNAADYQSYVDVETFTEGGNQMPNVERVLSATIIINTEDGDDAKVEANRPTQVVAVLNPGIFLDNESFSSFDGLNSFNAKAPTLAQLKTVIKNHVSDATSSTEQNGTFMMTNSVYVDNGAEKFAVSTEGHFYNENGPALNNPVDIYVERAVAKARVDISASKATDSEITDSEKAYYTYIKLMDAKNTTQSLTFGEDNEQLYLKLSKWDVTCTPNVGYLAKHVETSWTTETLWSSWTYPTFFRSFWAKNPTFGAATSSSTEGYKGLTWTATWNNVQTNGVSYGYKNGEKIENSNIRYMNENAPQAIYDKDTNFDQFTKILLCGQIVKSDGTPVSIASYIGQNMTVENLKAAVISNLQIDGTYYYKKNEAGNGYVSIGEDDIEFKTASADAIDKAEDKEYGEKGVRCYVYPQLKTGTYYTASVKDATDLTDSQASVVADLSKLNADLINGFGRAKIWNDGMTYYYITLQHLNSTDKVGGYGVVRNHIYDCDITSIAGLGTPVYDKDEVIYPEKPAEDEWKLAARIRILSWRVVKNSYSVAW